MSNVIFAINLKLEEGKSPYSPVHIAFLMIVQAFAKELRNATRLVHDNIVKIEGFYFIDVIDGKHWQPVIVSKWAKGGTMTKYVKNDPKKKVIYGKL